MARYSNMRERDEQGRFLLEEDREYSRGGPRRRYEDEVDYRSSPRSVSRGRDADEGYRRSDEGRGHGGWFGDSEGHSEASRRGWRSSDHGESGWYGDPEGHSEASRRGWQRSDHRESGWFGDPEGHSEAARRGWDEGNRSQRRDDEGSYRSRSRYDDERRARRMRHEDEDERSSRGRDRGHGGWFGNSEGHSEASRRGWDRR